MSRWYRVVEHSTIRTLTISWYLLWWRTPRARDTTRTSICRIHLRIRVVVSTGWWHVRAAVCTLSLTSWWCVAPAALMVCTTCGVLSVWHVVPPAAPCGMCIPSVHTPSWHLLCVDVVHAHSHTHSVAHVGACTCSTMDVGCSGTWYVHVDVCVENTLTDAPHIHLMTAFTPSVGVCVPPSTSCTYHSQDGAGSGRMYRWM